MRRSALLAWTTIGLFWTATLIDVAFAVTSYRRTTRWESVIERGGDAQAAIDADQLYIAVWKLSWVLLIACAASLGAWSRLIALNARTRRVENTRPWWAALAWFIPVFGIHYGLGELRRAVSGVGASERRLNAWNYSLYARWVFAAGGFGIASSAWKLDLPTMTRLHREVFILCVLAALSIAAAAFSTRAIIVTDRSVSRRRQIGKVLSIRPVES